MSKLDFELVYAGKKTVEEVTSINRTSSFKHVLGDKRAKNLLLYADNVQALLALAEDPRLKMNPDLVYIDPPYATGRSFQTRNQEHAYSDLEIGAHFIEFLRIRLILLREILSEHGSIYVHLDSKMAYPMKVIMDEIFGPDNFRGWITRKKCNPKNSTRKTYGNISDYILFYSKSKTFTFNRPVDKWSDEYVKKEYPAIDAKTGRRYKKVPIHAPGERNGETGKKWRGMLPPPGKHWQYTPSRLTEMNERGEIYWSPNGNPRRKIFFDPDKSGTPYQDIWLDFKDAHNQNIHITGYPTEKNINMLKLMIEASSNPGERVLDAFAGSGTTAAAADMVGRKWLMIDREQQAIYTMLQRFTSGIERMGDFVGKQKISGRPQATAALSSFQLLVDSNDKALPALDDAMLKTQAHHR